MCMVFYVLTHSGFKVGKEDIEGRGAWQIMICNMYYANTNKTNNILYSFFLEQKSNGM